MEYYLTTIKMNESYMYQRDKSKIMLSENTYTMITYKKFYNVWAVSFLNGHMYAYAYYIYVWVLGLCIGGYNKI